MTNVVEFLMNAPRNPRFWYFPCVDFFDVINRLSTLRVGGRAIAVERGGARVPESDHASDVTRARARELRRLAEADVRMRA